VKPRPKPTVIPAQDSALVIPAQAPLIVIPAQASALVIPAQVSALVIPAQAGIQSGKRLDPGFRRGDDEERRDDGLLPG